MNEILLTSIKGIEREIKKRNQRLNERRCWIRDEFRGKWYTWKWFYLGGYKILQEIKKLKIIKLQLEVMLLHEYEYEYRYYEGKSVIEIDQTL